MKTFVFISSLLASWFGAPSAPTQQELTPEVLVQRRIAADKYASSNKSSLTYYAKQPTRLLPLAGNSTVPDGTETVFTIVRNKQNKILLITETPTSQSGDWHIEYSQYFDDKGNRFAFKRSASFFNSGCTPGVAHETRVRYYDPSYKSVKSTYTLTDERNKPLTKGKCTFPYNYSYTLSNTVSDYLKRNKLPATL
ncbi:hypothetical protein E5K00_10280 [Hymenobacter aquaticus]|uniref:Uncharacterized protein n=1 Tax=Hymenobacter aquaticus TaxID=1867101 RepID=A0A4Z0Q643_9BACT|nr:hypothetical protein [Hymenobacter aquaticus]TGE25548.1 hypothetical protein E5K00_10280 [Hymenobacter aquaticus]